MVSLEEFMGVAGSGCGMMTLGRFWKALRRRMELAPGWKGDVVGGFEEGWSSWSRSLSSYARRWTFPVASPIRSFEKSFEKVPKVMPPETSRTWRTNAFPGAAWTFQAFTRPSEDPV